jgi:hypothetical protein
MQMSGMVWKPIAVLDEFSTGLERPGASLLRSALEVRPGRAPNRARYPSIYARRGVTPPCGKGPSPRPSSSFCTPCGATRSHRWFTGAL